METMEAKQKNFFTSLRHLAGDVQRQVEQLHSKIMTPVKQRAEIGDRGEALSLLKELNKDIKQLKANMIETLGSITDDGGLSEALPLVQALLDVYEKRMDDLEAYLKCYGFTLFVHPDIKEACTPGKSPEPPDLSKTPKQSSHHKKKRHSSAGDVTPKLEDFGSPGFLKRIYSIGNDRAAAADHAGSAERDSPDTNLFKVPAAVNKCGSIVTNTPVQMMQRKWSSMENIPEQFQHSGIVVTPGVLSGRGVALQTPTPLASDGHVFTPSQQSLMKPFKLDADENFTDGSPVPPVLRTPGLKQIRKFTPETNNFGDHSGEMVVTKLDLDACSLGAEDSESPVPPILKTPGSKQICRNTYMESEKNLRIPEVIGCEDVEDSPVPPILMTPGIKQVKHHSRSVENNVRCLPNIVTEDSDIVDYSPIPPILSCGIKLKKDVSDTVDSSDQDAGSTDVSPAVPIFVTPGLMIRTKSHLQKPENVGNQKAGHLSYEASPVFPNLSTVNLQQSIYHDKQPTTTSSHNLSIQGFNNPVLSQSSYTDDPPTPQPPELTVNFADLNASLPAPPTKIHQMSVPATPEEPSLPLKRSAPVGKGEPDAEPPFPKLKGTYEFSLDSKENVPPETDWDRSAVRKIKEVLLTEYSSQQDYIQRLLPLSTINEAIEIFNKLLEEKVAAGKCASLGDADMEPYLGQNCKFFFLLMLKLRRVMRGRGSTVGGSYVVL